MEEIEKNGLKGGTTNSEKQKMKQRTPTGLSVKQIMF